MVASALGKEDKSERERFKNALNERVAAMRVTERDAKDFNDRHGAAQWLYMRIQSYCKHNRGKFEKVTAQSCGYWLRGDKYPNQQNRVLISNALGLSLGQLMGYGLSSEGAAILDGYENAPDHIREAVRALLLGGKEQAG